MLEAPDHQCGVGAVVDPSGARNVAPFAGPLLRRLEHRGSGACGAAWIDTATRELGVVHREGRARQVLPQLQAETSSLIIHALYRTNPDSKPHPVTANYHGTHVTVAFNGNIPPTARERNAQLYLESQGFATETRSDTELVARLIALHLHDTAGNMRKVFERLPEHLGDGAYNIVTLGNDGHVHAMRDPRGVHPLVFGTTQDGLHAIASEDQALERVWKRARQISVARINPGMMVHLGPGVLTPELDQVHKEDPKHCSFEWAYFADFMANLDGARVLSVRRAFGQALAKLDEQDKLLWRHPVVVPIPDSARIAAEGYADEAHIPHSDALLKIPDAMRSFIDPGDRRRIIREKFDIEWSMIAGRDVVLIDDSLVRGTTSKEIIDLLRDPAHLWYKLRELVTSCTPLFKKYGMRPHWRFAFPPIIAPCFYGIDFSTREELFVPKFSSEPFAKADGLSPDVLQNIAVALGAQSVKFLPIHAVHEAVGMDEDALCRACFTGHYPTPGGQELYELQLRRGE